MSDLTREEIEAYRKKHLLPRGFGNKLNELDHQICDMALKGAARPEERTQNVLEGEEGGSGAANWNRSNPAPFGSDPGPSAEADCARNTIDAKAWKLIESFAAPVGMDMASCQESWGTEGEAKYLARTLLFKRLRMNSGSK